MYWGASHWFAAVPDPREPLVDESRPPWQLALRWLLKAVALSYAVSAAIWLVVAPLVASRYHLVSPIGIVLGPPLTLLTSIALIAGFLLLLSAAVCWPMVPLFAWVTRWCVAG